MPLLTIYRPNFCAECGVKVVRLSWHPWTSRRFCGSCSPRFRNEHWLQLSLAVLALLVLGITIGRALRRDPPPVTIQRTSNVTAPAQMSGSPGVTASGPPSAVDEQVYMCGARTKKGTPCSRRVHGLVRCWQHKGLPAMLPAEKLIIRD